MKISDALVHALMDLNVKYVFGVSGANIEHLHDAIHRLGGSQLQSVMAKCEIGAAFMADCHARVHRTLGVCCATSGGGMTYLLSGIAESFAEGVPVLAIVGQPPQELEGNGAFQDSSGQARTVDALKLFESVSKYACKINKAEEFWPKYIGALQSALMGRPGPSVILIPRNLYDQEVDECPAYFLNELKSWTMPHPPNPEMLNPLFKALNDAKKPILIIGQGVRRSPNAEYVREFARTTQIPVATTMSARADYPNHESNYLGIVGVAGHPSVHRFIEEEADLLLVVGSRMGIMTRAPITKALSEKKLVMITEDLATLCKSLKPTLSVQADTGRVFQSLLKDSTGKKPAPRLARHIYAPTRVAKNHLSGSLKQSEALALIDEILPEYGHLVFDAGNCAAAALHYTHVPAGASSSIALGMGAMGYAMGGAVGAQFGSPNGSRTVAFVGDGAFLMTGLELHTAVEHRLPILFIVFNNGKHGMCVARQNLYFEGREECATYSPINVAQVARGLGRPEQLWVERVESLKELEAALEDYMLNKHIPGVLELVLGVEETPPFTPFLGKDAPTIELKGSLKNTLLRGN